MDDFKEYIAEENRVREMDYKTLVSYVNGKINDYSEHVKQNVFHSDFYNKLKSVMNAVAFAEKARITTENGKAESHERLQLLIRKVNKLTDLLYHIDASIDGLRDICYCAKHKN